MTNTKIPKPPGALPAHMDCIVVGGCAAGLLLGNVRSNAGFIRLARPEGIKPLTNPEQEQPEIEYEEDIYEVHPITLTDTGVENKAMLYGIAVVKDKSLTWAFSQLIMGYVENETNKMVEESLKHHIQ